MLHKGLSCGRLRGNSSTFQMSREGVNSGIKRYQVARAKGDWRPRVGVLMQQQQQQQQRLAAMLRSSICTQWDQI